MTSLNPKEAQKKVLQWVEQSKTLRIFIFGKLGTGKSSLINSLLNKEVAKEGYGLLAVTKVAEPHSNDVELIKLPELNIAIHNVHVTLWDTPGLQDPHTGKCQILKKLKTQVSAINADLYIYCTKMTQTRAEEGDSITIADLTEALGNDFWKHTVFAMTFANQFTKPESHPTTLGRYFEERLADWATFLHSAVREAGVSKFDAENIPVIPTGYRKQPFPLIDQTGNCWFTQFWSICITRMKFMSIPAFLTVNQEEWIDHNANQRMIGGIISRHLKAVGVEVDLSGVTEENIITYLRDAITSTLKLTA